MRPPRRRLVLPLLLGVAFVVLFDSAVVYPFRLFVVLLHEVSHGLAAILSGGAVVSIAIRADEGGACLTRGGWPFLILNAGYLGSLLFGVLFLTLAARRRAAAAVIGTIGVITSLVALVYVRTWFGFAYCLLTGLALVVVGTTLAPVVSEVLLSAIGAMSALYAVADIASDVIFRHSVASDAWALARLTGLPALVWGFVWITLSTVTLATLVRRLS